MTITVKVAVVPGPTTEYVLNDGATVGDALGLANVTMQEGYSLKVNGVAASTSQSLSNGSIITLAKEAKSA